MLPAQGARRPPARAGFTLVELLVCIGIIGLVVGLALPAVMGARESSRRAQCLSQLHQAGVAFHLYLQYNKERFPDAAILPSLTPSRPSLMSYLEPYMEENRRVYACPSDVQYFEVEGTSYEYPATRLANKTLVEASVGKGTHTIWMLYDFDPFHGLPKQVGSRNFLHADGHAKPL